VSGCNLYLESLPSDIDGAPPWTPTNRDHGITSRPLTQPWKSHLETPRNYALTQTNHSQSIKKDLSCIYIYYVNPYYQSLPCFRSNWYRCR